VKSPIKSFLAVTSKSRARFSRRSLLTHLGASAAMLPLLTTTRIRAANAAGNAKRLVTLTWCNGLIPKDVFPKGAELEFGQMMQSLLPYKAKTLFLAGLDTSPFIEKNQKYMGHFTYSTLFTGKGVGAGTRCSGTEEQTSDGPSIDYVIGTEIAKRANLKETQINLGCRTAAPRIGTTWRAARQPNECEKNPYNMFNRLFSGGAMPAGQIDSLRDRRKSVLDFMGKDLTAFASRLGSDDKMKIEAHLASVRELETKLTTVPGATQSCAPTAFAQIDFAKPVNYPAHVKLQLDLIALALRCDITRVATLELTNAGESGFVPPFAGVSRDYHSIAHAQNGGSADAKMKIDTWYFEQVAYLAKQLDDVQETGGTMLDNSSIVVANCMQDGAGHNVDGMPWIIVGSCGGYFKTNRVLRMGSWAGKTGDYWKGSTGVSHAKLLASLCQAMDLNVASFGDPRYGGTGPLPGLTA
jgi:hypothetical protein